MKSQETNVISDSVEGDKTEINKISVNKFIILSVVTCGLYEIWWIYKSWCFFRDREKSEIMPAMRTVFSIFYLISLFYRILKLAKNNGYRHDYISVLLFIGYIIVNSLSILPSPYFFAAIFSFVFLIPPFKALNFAFDYCEGFRIREQNSFSIRQILLLIAGVVLWVLILLKFI